MTIPVHTLGDYLDLLAEQNLLAAPIPDGLDRSQRVTGLTCDSRQVAPGTLFDKLPEDWVCPECAEAKENFIEA